MDDEILRSREFGGVYLDRDNRTIYFFADCPPFGQTRINLATDAIDVQLDIEMSDKENSGKLVLAAEMDFNKAADSVGMLDELAGRWQEVWSEIYKALVAVRNDYGCDQLITTDKAKITVSPPGDFGDIELENWSCALEMDTWDGYFEVEFDLSGSIIDSTATF